MCFSFGAETPRSGHGVSDLRQMDLEALADFVLVATHGGLGKAARSTGRSKATLSRKVSELEEALQVRLVERGATHLRLTAVADVSAPSRRGVAANSH